MRRRGFIVGLLAGAFGWHTAGAQPTSRIPRIGYLASVPTANTTILDALRAGLGALDWVEGGNFTVEYRWSNDRDELLPDLAADLVRLGVTLIVVPGSTFAEAACASLTRFRLLSVRTAIRSALATSRA